MHYYKFGSGPKAMLCFHGYGMHGKQFRLLEETLGDQYTFYGFDLFFHKETRLRDNSLHTVKRGILKSELKELFEQFCLDHGIERFSVLAYSMGSHYSTTLVEEMPERIEEFLVAAPASLRPGLLVTFLSRNPIGNKILERMALSEKAMPRLLSVLKKVRFIDSKAYAVLLSELGTSELRYAFYACTSYMQHLKINEERFVRNMNDHQIKGVFVFGIRDRSYPETIGNRVIPKIRFAKKVLMDANHEMINPHFGNLLKESLHDH